MGKTSNQRRLKMLIKIRSNAHDLYADRVNTGNYMRFNDEWYNQLKLISGKTIKVDTKHLFRDQFNTVPIEGVSKNGMRIGSESVEEVIDDEREWMLRCTYCGQMSEVSWVTSERCPHCNEGDYLVPLSNEAKISFDYKMRAKSERAAGGKCEVNDMLPTIAINTSAGEEYFFQGEEASNLIETYESYDWISCTLEEWLLAIVQNW